MPARAKPTTGRGSCPKPQHWSMKQEKCVYKHCPAGQTRVGKKCTGTKKPATAYTNFMKVMLAQQKKAHGFKTATKTDPNPSNVTSWREIFTECTDLWSTLTVTQKNKYASSCKK